MLLDGKTFKGEDVENAMQLVAMGVAGFLSPSYAKTHLETLPEELRRMVMSCTLAAKDSMRLAQGETNLLDLIKHIVQCKVRQANEEELEKEEPKEEAPKASPSIESLLKQILDSMNS